MTTIATPPSVAIERRELPPLPIPDPALGKLARLDRFDTYAESPSPARSTPRWNARYWDESYGDARP